MAFDGALVDRPVVDEIAAACHLLGAADLAAVWQLPDGLVEHGLSLASQLHARATAVESVLLREAETRGLKARTGAPTTEKWLGDIQRLSRADANARTRLASALGRHARVAAALIAGVVTVEQAEVVVTVMDQVLDLPGLVGYRCAGDGGTDDGAESDESAGDADAAVEFLLEQCAALGPRELARAGQAVVEALTRHPSIDDPRDEEAVRRDHDAVERDLQEKERNWLHVVRRPGGGKQLRIDLGTVGQAAFEAWCRAEADRPAKGEDGFEDVRTRAERRGDAFVDLLHLGTPGTRAASATRTSNGTGTGTETETATGAGASGPEDSDESAGDAPLGTDTIDDGWCDPDEFDRPGQPGVLECDSALFELPVPVPSAKQEPVPGEWSGVVLDVITTLAELRAGVPGSAHLDTGAPLSVAAVRLLACDSHLVPAVMDGASQVLDLGRSCRPFNRAQRRAAGLRDRGCVAPGCDVPPSACHLHHCRWWSRGGPTDIANAALLCMFHHRMVHRQDWDITLAANGFPQLHPPPHIDPTGRPRQHHRFTVPDRIVLPERRLAALTRAACGSDDVLPHPRT
jgi:hypothetical protein